MTEIAKIELVAFNIGIKIPFSGCDQNLILRIYSFALWFLQKLQSFLFTGLWLWVLRKIWNVLHQIHLEIRDWSVKISVSWLQPAACRQWFVLNLFQREREGGNHRVHFDECRRNHDQWPSCCFMQIIFALQSGKDSGGKTSPKKEEIIKVQKLVF